MADIDPERCKLNHVTFQGCWLDAANFRFAELNEVKFEDAY